jgi:hypothetical protein
MIWEERQEEVAVSASMMSCLVWENRLHVHVPISEVHVRRGWDVGMLLRLIGHCDMNSKMRKGEQRTRRHNNCRDGD